MKFKVRFSGEDKHWKMQGTFECDNFEQFEKVTKWMKQNKFIIEMEII